MTEILYECENQLNGVEWLKINLSFIYIEGLRISSEKYCFDLQNNMIK